MSRTLLNIVFPLISFPYITRILSPSGIGNYDFSKSIVSYFVLVAALGVTQYAVREGSAIRDKKIEMYQFSSEMFSINLYSSIIAYTLLIGLTCVVPQLRANAILIIIFSFQILFNLLSVEWLFNIYEDFGYITIRSFIFQLISVILMFIFVKEKDDYITYACITTFSMGGAYVINYFHSREYTKIRLVSPVRLMKHLKSVITLFFGNVASIIYLNSDVTIIGFLSGNYYVGIYSIAVKIYTIVKQLTNAVLMATIPRLAYQYNNGEKNKYYELLSNIFWTMLTIISPSIVGLIILRVEIVQIVAGNNYARSIYSLTILSIGLLISIISAFLVHGVLLVQRKENVILKITAISASVNIILNLITVPIAQEKGAAISTVFSELLIAFLGYRSAKGLIKIDFSIKKLMAIIIGCILITISCVIIKIIFSSALIIMSIAIPISLLIYGITLKIFDAVPKL